MFEKFKNLIKRIINLINPKQKQAQLDTLNYEKIISLMKEDGAYEKFGADLSNFDEIEELMQNKTNLHGINHIIRVLFNAYAITTLEGLSNEDRNIIIEAAKFHDIGRKHDGENEIHGEEGANIARTILENKGFSPEDIDKICFIIKEHSLPKAKNEQDIQLLPENLRKQYKYYLDLLKDADKLDRVRIGDLDPSRLATNSAKRLVGVAQDIFQNNRYYYKKKLKVYPYNEEEANRINEEIKKLNLKYNITLEDIKKNYSKFKTIEEQGKLKWLKYKANEVPLNDFIEIINILSEEDLKYIELYGLGRKLIIKAIYDMGIDKFIRNKIKW